MKKLFPLLVAGLLLCSCNNAPKSSNDSDNYLKQIRAESAEMAKYRYILLKPEVLSVDVRIKADEKLTDIYVLTDDSHDVVFTFEPFRIYTVFLQKDEKPVSWGKKEIKTDKRTIRVNLIQE